MTFRFIHVKHPQLSCFVCIWYVCLWLHLHNTDENRPPLLCAALKQSQFSFRLFSPFATLSVDNIQHGKQGRGTPRVLHEIVEPCLIDEDTDSIFYLASWDAPMNASNLGTFLLVLSLLPQNMTSPSVSQVTKNWESWVNVRLWV